MKFQQSRINFVHHQHMYHIIFPNRVSCHMSQLQLEKVKYFHSMSYHRSITETRVTFKRKAVVCISVDNRWASDQAAPGIAGKLGVYHEGDRCIDWFHDVITSVTLPFQFSQSSFKRYGQVKLSGSVRVMLRGHSKQGVIPVSSTRWAFCSVSVEGQNLLSKLEASDKMAVKVKQQKTKQSGDLVADVVPLIRSFNVIVFVPA